MTVKGRSATTSLIEVTPQFQPPERRRPELPGAFEGRAELLADFPERAVGVHADALAHPQDAFLALG